VFAIFHAERLFMPFLALLGVTFPPVAAINILHTLWPWSERASGQAAVRPPAIRRAGVLAWIAGSVTGYFTSNGYFTVTGIASIDSVLIAAGVWLLVTTMNRARRPGAPWALKKA
jgi:purine-cytosine permease-like protein